MLRTLGKYLLLFWKETIKLRSNGQITGLAVPTLPSSDD